MRGPYRGAVLLCIALVASGPAVAEDPPRDPRISEADALLGESEHYERAIELYRAVLAEDPDRAEVRLKLARVLSWDRQFDPSIEAYDALVSEGSVETARVERAEVLSWAERYLEAETAFRQLLAENPRDARAARGLARTLSWDGRRNKAARAYDDALDIEEDADARREWSRLQEGYRPTLHSESEHLLDSDDFELVRTHLEHRTHLDYETQVLGGVGFVDVGTRQAGIPADRGYETTFGVRRAVTETLSAEFHAGVRGYESYGVFPILRAELAYALGNASLTLDLDHRDALDRTVSARAADRGIHDTSFGLSAWKPLGEHMELWGRVSGAALSDSNGRHGIQGSVSWRPWTERQLRFTASTGYSGYTIDTPHYYSPRVDTTTRIGASHRLGMPGGFSIDIDAGAGFGYSREKAGGPQVGPAYDLRGAISWLYEPVLISLRLGRSQSQRGNRYETTTAGVAISVDL